MPAPRPDDRSGYDYDEIMRRLRSGQPRVERQSEEVVIDEKTGEKRVRVRRRRRSGGGSGAERKERSAKAFNRLLTLSWVGLAALVLAAIGFWFLRVSRFQSASFASAFTRQLDERLPGVAQSSNWQVRFNQLFANRISYTGGADELLATVELRGVEADTNLRSLLGSQNLDLSYIQAKTGEALLQFPQEPAAEVAQATGTPAAAPWQAPVPAEIGVKALGVNRMRVRFPAQPDDRGHDEVFGYSEGSLVYELASRSLGLSGGELRLQGWPRLEINEGRGQVSPGGQTLELQSLTAEVLDPGPQGELRFQGSIPLRGAGALELKFAGTGLTADGLLGSSPFDGRFNGGLSLHEGSLQLVAGQSPRLSCRIESENLQLMDFEGLGTLSDELMNAQIREPRLEKVQANLSCEDGVWRVSGLRGQIANTPIRFAGDFRWSAAAELTGEMQLAVPMAVLSDPEMAVTAGWTRLFVPTPGSADAVAKFTVAGNEGALTNRTPGVGTRSGGTPAATAVAPGAAGMAAGDEVRDHPAAGTHSAAGAGPVRPQLPAAASRAGASGLPTAAEAENAQQRAHALIERLRQQRAGAP